MVLADILTPAAPASALAYLRKAAGVATESDHGIYKLGAILVKNGNVVGIGWNQNKTHPKAKNYTRLMHAELDAIITAGCSNGTLGTDMYVARITKGGKMATSKPCRDCWILLKEAGLKSVTYIDEGGLICSEKL